MGVSMHIYVHVCAISKYSHIQDTVIWPNGNIMESISILIFWDSSYSFSLKTLRKAIYLPAAVGSPGETHTST